MYRGSNGDRRVAQEPAPTSSKPSPTTVCTRVKGQDGHIKSLEYRSHHPHTAFQMSNECEDCDNNINDGRRTAMVVERQVRVRRMRSEENCLRRIIVKWCEHMGCGDRISR
eukprot:c17204_g1_i1.p1 GENE.c17204_g1_i1~~c17204_g1_i1.p1  ORF type:complete len:111 (+),score=2.60 c17204_g1_i1:126-458(+)